MPKAHKSSGKGRSGDGGEEQMPSMGGGEGININTASIDEIRAMCEVGPSTAESIVKAREEEPFESIDDVARVPGIAEKTVEKMRSHGCYAG